MKTDSLIMKNKRTKQPETILMKNVEALDWGFRFFVGSELEAYKAAYQYRHSPSGVRIEFAQGAESWMVTVFNGDAKAMGCDGAK